MKLTRITLRRMPGLPEPFTVDDIGPGLNVIVGPNGVGKSSTMRALRALLWSDGPVSGPADVSAAFVDGGVPVGAALQTPGRTTWQRAGQVTLAPALPEARFAPCFFPSLLDLLTLSRDDDALGKEIATQLSGGYSVSALLANGRFGPPGRPGQSENKAFADAKKTVGVLQSGQAALARAEDELTANRRQLDGFRAANRRLEILRRAANRLDAIDKLARAEQARTAFPTGMERLHGDERNRLKKLQADAENAKNSALLAAGEADKHEAERLATGLAVEIDDATLTSARGSAEEARKLERAVDDLTARIGEGRAKRTLAQARLGGGTTPPKLDADVISGIERLVQAEVALTVENERLIAELDALGAPGASDDRAIREAAAALRAWLALPRVLAVGSKVRGVAVLLAVVLLAVATMLAFTVGPGWGLLAFVALVLGLAALLLDPSPADQRPGLVQRFVATGVAPPSEFTPAAVEARLAELDAELAQVADARVRESRRSTLNVALTALRERASRHERELQRARDTLGVALGGALTLSTLADAIRAYAASDADVTGLEARHEQVAEQLVGRLRQVSDVVARFDGKAGHAEEAVAAVTILERRSQALKRATEQRDDARRREQAALQAYNAGNVAIADLIVTAGAADEPDLVARLDQLAAWKVARDASKAAGGAVAETERVLGDHPDVVALDAVTLARETERTAADAAKAEPLQKSITETETLVNAARAGRDLEKALADRTATEQALDAARDDALARSAGRFLLQTVEKQHEAESRPVVLQRAMATFATFTRHAWSLVVDRTGVFRATETSTGEGHALSELSDDTRAQLLLAVRLAFAAQAELTAGADVRLPFVLDEALSISDPARFDAVIESLAELVRTEDRQVFYVTSQPVDAERWRLRAGTSGETMRLIDLGAIRRLQAAAPDVALDLPAQAEVPSPAGDDAVAYALRLAVPRFAPLLGADAQHPYYLLHDDLPGLHDVLRLRVGSVGALRNLLGSAGGLALAGSLRARVTERILWLDAFAGAFSEGRGRPVDRTVLASTGFGGSLDAVVELAERSAGDARAPRRVARWRRAKDADENDGRSRDLAHRERVPGLPPGAVRGGRAEPGPGRGDHT